MQFTACHSLHAIHCMPHTACHPTVVTVTPTPPHPTTGQRETVHVTFNAAAAPSTLVPLNLLWLAALTALVASAILLLLHLVSPAQPYIPHPQPPPSPLPTPSPQRPGSAFHTPGSSAFSPVSPYSQMGSPSPEYVNYAGRTIHRAPGYTNPMEDPRSMY
ncbi:unnamed protein product [Closterium sp. NIES-54]